MPPLSDASQRRQLLLGIVAVGIVGVAAGRTLRDAAGLPEMSPIPSAPGFARLPTQSGLSGAGFLGIGQGRGGGASPGPYLGADELERALFRARGPGVPIAVFSDYFCPVCPQVAPLLRRVQQPVAVTWHEWPVLGPRSDLAARVGVAAAQFVDPGVVHETLMAIRLRPSDEGARAAAEALDLEMEALRGAMHGAKVSAQLEQTAALAYQMGFQGTPAFVIGQTVVSGLPDLRLLRRLVKRQTAHETSGSA